jgi:hypothetical protein
MKECPKCKVKKDFSEFGKCASKKDGLQSNCKECRKAYRQENKKALRKKASKYYERNKQNIKERVSKYAKENIGKIREYKKEYRSKNQEKIREDSRKYHQENKKRILEYQKDYYKIKSDKIKEYQKRYNELNADKVRIRSKRYTDSVKNRRNAYERERRKKDLGHRFLFNARARISTVIKRGNGSKSIKTKELLGCSIPHLKKHLEKQFTKGMTWENYGDWHIDHIIPCASFDLTDPIQQRQCFHFTNLQPLWAEENLRKSDRIVSPTQMNLPL